LNTARYSYSWSLGVVNDLKRKYPRATEMMKQILDLSDRNLVAYLATGDPLWPDLRNMVHALDNASDGRRTLDMIYTTEQMLSHLRQYWHCKCAERIWKRIDGVRE